MVVATARPAGPLVVALIGGVAAGKSTVAAEFAALGAAVIDTDALAHALTAPAGAALPALVTAFGPDILANDGSMDRRAMRARVFADAGARRVLEGILHPLVGAAATRALAEVQEAYALLAVPLFVETGRWRTRVQRVLAVDCPVELQRQRALQRPGITAAEVDAILVAQASRGERLAVADDVIDNSREAADLRPKVVALHQLYLGLAGARAPVPDSPQEG